MKNKIIFTTIFISLLAHKALAGYPLPNPLGINTVPKLAERVINGILGVVGAVALLYMVWGGVTWMTSGGNSERIKKGKDTVVWAILGLALIFSSYVIVEFVLEVLGDAGTAD